MLLGFDLPDDRHRHRHAARGRDQRHHASSTSIAAIFNWFIPDTGVDHRDAEQNPFYLIREFSHCVSLLWRDKLGQISLATTTLFWGAGATLQFIVHRLGGEGARASTCRRRRILQGVVAVGIAVGAVLAATLRHRCAASVNVLPIGVAMGLVVITMMFVTHAAGRGRADDRHRRVRRASSSCR